MTSRFSARIRFFFFRADTATLTTATSRSSASAICLSVTPGEATAAFSTAALHFRRVPVDERRVFRRPGCDILRGIEHVYLTDVLPALPEGGAFLDKAVFQKGRQDGGDVLAELGAQVFLGHSVPRLDRRQDEGRLLVEVLGLFRRVPLRDGVGLLDAG